MASGNDRVGLLFEGFGAFIEYSLGRIFLARGDTVPSWSIEGKKSRMRLHVVRRLFAASSNYPGTRVSLKQVEQGFMEKQIEPVVMANLHDDTYWKKLVDRVRDGLRPDFDAGTEHTSREVRKLRRQIKRRLDTTDSSLAALQTTLQSSVEALQSSLNDIKKNLE